MKPTKEILRCEEREDALGKYKYELSVREGESLCDFGIPLYSVKIELQTGDGASHTASIEDGFSDAERATEFFNRAVRLLATPSNLPYVYEDEFKA